MALNDFNPSGPCNNPPNGNGSGSNGVNGNTNGTGNNGNNGGNGGGPQYPWSNFTGPIDDDDNARDSAIELLINYNEKFKNAIPTMFRDNVIHQTISCLIGKFKPNAMLVGAAGTGKTKIVEDIARRIATDDPTIPDTLKGYTIYELPLTNIMAGSSLVGAVEAKTKRILKFASDPANKVILFIDEIHLLRDGGHEYEKISQIFKPALARGDIKVIGATTLQESQVLYNDPAFNRRFTRVIVDELSQEQTVEILKSIENSLIAHYQYKIALTDKVLEEVVKVADEFKTIVSHRPDNAITLLDRSMADAYLQRKLLEVNALNDPTLAAALAATPAINLSKSQMKKTAMKLMTGNNEKTEVSPETLRDKLSVIKGQDEAINYIIDTIERDNLNLKPRTKPLTLLFAGNSGVGKTEVAKIIAHEITGLKPIILNMTEYKEPTAINRIIGSDAGFVGYDDKNELPFDILQSNPYQIILLDEFEKCHKSVQRLFMSAFDEGYIKTAKGTLIDFSKSIIIATTNAGHTNKSDAVGFFANTGNSNNATINDLAGFFDIELLNRFTKVLNFNAITEPIFREILVDTYKREIALIKEQHSSYNFMPDELDDATADQLVKDNFAKQFGARPINNAVQRYIEDTIIDYKKNKTVSNVLTPVIDEEDSSDVDTTIDTNE